LFPWIIIKKLFVLWIDNSKNSSVIIENDGKINLINFEERDNTKLITCKTIYGKNSFTEVSKNLAICIYIYIYI